MPGGLLMSVKMKKIIISLFVLFIFSPVHATLYALKNNLVQLTDHLKVLEETLYREAQKNQQIIEAQRKQAALERELEERNRVREELRLQQVRAQQERERHERRRLEEQRIEREKREREEERRRLAQEQREREAEAKRQEELRLQEERELQQALETSRLEEEQRIERERRKYEEEQRRLIQLQLEREREAEAKRQEELRLQQEREQQERERQAAEKRRLEEQRIEREKRKKEEEQRRLAQKQREREAEAKRQEELRLQQERERLALEKRRLEEQRIEREKREREEERRRLIQKQREREVEVKRQEKLRLQQEREQQELERRKLEEQKKLPFFRITTVPYDSKGDWVDNFVEQIDGSSKIEELFFGGYIFLGSPLLIKGVRTSPGDDSELVLKSYYNAPAGTPEERLKKIKEDLVGLYKIHLMPKDANDFMIILEQFLKALGTNPALQKAVNTLKVRSDFDFEENPQILKEKLTKEYGNEVPPIMVIAPSLGKENAQLVLDAVYNLFKDIKGLDLTPRFNEKITDLIYYAQGNGDDKIARPEYFTDDKILYKPDFVSEKNPQDYHLRNPANLQ